MKNRLLCLFACLTIASGLIAAPRAHAQIAVGIDWRNNIYLQEYWRDGMPRYLIFSGRDADVTVAVYPRMLPEGVNPATLRLGGPWKVPAHGVVDVDATSLLGQELVAWRMGNGKTLGLMFAPRAAPSKVVIYNGFNGDGGTNFDLSTEQDKIAWQPGEVAEYRLRIPAGLGVLHFKKVLDAAIDPKAVQVPIKDAVCDSLAMTNSDAEITIDATKALDASTFHTVKLHFIAPQTPGVYYVTGSIDFSGGRGGMGITRGLAVALPGKSIAQLPAHGLAPVAVGAPVAPPEAPQPAGGAAVGQGGSQPMIVGTITSN